MLLYDIDVRNVESHIYKSMTSWLFRTSIVCNMYIYESKYIKMEIKIISLS